MKMSRRNSNMQAGRIALATGLMLALALANATAARAQSTGDYRSAATGNWNAAATWERFDGSAWVAAAASPTTADGVITIRSPHVVTISASVAYDQVVVDAGGQVTVASTVTSTLSDGDGMDLTINGTWLNSGGTWTALGYWTVNANGTYIHNTTSSAATPLGHATLDPSSTVIYRGSSTLTPAVAWAGRTYGNLSFESTSGSWGASLSGTSNTAINGNLTIGSGVTLTSTHTGNVTIAGNYTNDGAFALSTGMQRFTFTGAGKTIGGSGALDFEEFTLASGASITLTSPATILSSLSAGQVNAGAVLALSDTLTNNDTVYIYVGGTLQLNQGGWATGGVWYYYSNWEAGNATLAFNTNDLISIGDETAFWPSSHPPNDVNILSGGIQMNTARGLYSLQTAGRIDNGSNLTVWVLCQINAGGYFTSGGPTYYGLLKYNTGGTYERGPEWSSTSGAGCPVNVQISNNTTLDLGSGNPSTARRMTGDLTIDAGSALAMDYGSHDMSAALTIEGNLNLDGTLSLSEVPGGDLYLGLGWNRTGSFYPNGRGVFFNGINPQTLTGATTFDYVTVNDTYGLMSGREHR